MLTLHVLNVGDGSCAIIDFESHRMGMVDIDNRGGKDDESDLTDPIGYYKNNIGSTSLFRFILTHPDMDHMSGLKELDEELSIKNFWDTKNQKEIDGDWEESPYREEDWNRYQELRQSAHGPTVIQARRYDEGNCCWVEDGITILSPTKALESKAKEDEDSNYHHLSYVLRIEYGGTGVILGGDASKEAWDSILSDCEDDLSAEVFVAPHHGSSNNRHKEAFEAIDPTDVIVSVKEDVDYDYDYFNELADNQVWSTKHHGDIVVEINSNGNYEISAENE